MLWHIMLFATLLPWTVLCIHLFFQLKNVRVAQRCYMHSACEFIPSLISVVHQELCQTCWEAYCWTLLLKGDMCCSLYFGNRPGDLSVTADQQTSHCASSDDGLQLRKLWMSKKQFNGKLMWPKIHHIYSVHLSSMNCFRCRKWTFFCQTSEELWF